MKNRLTAMREKIPDKTMVLLALNPLPCSYEAVVQQIFGGDTIPSFEKVVVKLMNNDSEALAIQYQ